ncbi:phosphatidate cytidylyltransferase [Leptospira sp. GIMC2001]|uniref:phosphatidate cytidylyltransferase n=1 Tax=Leptospira sp. GIMC2001 TaxID=1513297 RepID=UPI00234A0EFC|nr:phosphatidate cytidylyltransferase [Leptospira sp. GIMC2001]WCL48732.1 phosphatidate cytidylyltransferase [Leptospira sp. GIMC2001]
MGETAKRILSAIVLVALFLVAFLYSGVYYLDLFFFGALIIYLGQREFYDFGHREESQAFRGSGYVFGFVIFLVYYLQFIGIQKNIAPPSWVLEISNQLNSQSFSPVMALVIVLTILSFTLQIIKRPLDGAMMSVMTTVFGVLYVAVPIGHFLLLLSFPYGEYYIFLVCTITFISDAGAYFGGRWFGRNPAGLKISPKKTWEGYITGNISAVICVQILNYLWVYFVGGEIPVGLIESIALSVVLSLVSVLGDLAESALKRDAKIKDSASIIPGHGGVLDLADALLFTIPTIYFYFKIKGILGYTV